MTERMAAALALCLAALGGIGNAPAAPQRARPAVTPAAPRTARDGISGNSVWRAGARGLVGGPAAGKPSALSSVSLKQHH